MCYIQYTMTMASTIVYFWLNLCSPDPFSHRFSLSHWHNVGSLNHLSHLRCSDYCIDVRMCLVCSFFYICAVPTENMEYLSFSTIFISVAGPTVAVSFSFPFGTWNRKHETVTSFETINVHTDFFIRK